MKTLFKNFTLIDGTEAMAPVTGKFLLLEDNKIIDILDQEVEADNIIDLEGNYVVPGLVNMHIHLPGSGGLKNSANAKKLIKLILTNPIFKKIGLMLCKKNAKDQVLSGTTTVRCVGGVGHLDSEVRDLVNNGNIIGPRMKVADYAIAPVGGHMAGTVSFEYHTQKEIKEFIDDLASKNVDLVKIMITGGVLDGKEIGQCGLLKMAPEDVKFACDCAHEHNLKVAAHVEGKEGMIAAIEGGVDTIEHGAEVPDEYLDKFKARGGAVILTLSPAVERKYPPKLEAINHVLLENTKIILKAMIANAKKCLEKGITIGLGTDTGCPGVRHYDSYKEMLFAMKYMGFDAKKCLHLMTLNNAKILGIDQETGSIEKGKDADFVVLKSNPLDDLNVFADPKYVVFKGRIIKDPKIKRNKKIELFTSTKEIRAA